MWQRFSDAARKMVFYAQEEAGRLGENYVSTEHFLLGLLREPSNAGCQVLSRLGVSLEQVRTEIEQCVAQGEGRRDQDMQLTPRAKRVIDLAYDEARQQGANYIGSQHMLLGIIREAEGLGGRILAKVGVDLDDARRIVIDMEAEEGTVFDAEGRRAGAKASGRPAAAFGDAPRTSSESDERDAFDSDAVIEGQIASARQISAQMKGVVDDTLVAKLEAAASALEDMRRRHLDEIKDALKSLAERIQSVVAGAIERRAESGDQSGGDLAQGTATWQRFTQRARKVVFYAQEEAMAAGSDKVGPEHLLLGLVREADSVAARIFGMLGVSRDDVRAKVMAQMPRGPASRGDMQLADSAKRLIDYSYDEARVLNNNYIGTEHILLGYLRLEAAGGTAAILAELGVSPDRARGEVLRLQDGRPTPGPTYSPFTPAQAAITALNDTARRLVLEGAPGSHAAYGLHLLARLLGASECLAAQILATLGVEPAALKQYVADAEAALPAASHAESSAAPMRRVLEQAMEYAGETGETTIGTDHLLLALLSESDQPAAALLGASGIELGAVRDAAVTLRSRGLVDGHTIDE